MVPRYKMITAASAKRPGAQRILIVDDNQIGLRARQLVLEELGYKVTAVRSGEDALEQFCKHDFDLVVTDYRMPKVDGIQLISRLRDTKAGVPVVLISSVAEPLGLDESN